MILGQWGGQGRKKAGFLEMLAAATQVGTGQVGDGQGLGVGGGGIYLVVEGSSPHRFTDPAWVRLEVGTDLSSYAWTFERAPSPPPPPKKDGCSWETETIQGVIIANTNLAFIMSQALFQVLTCIGLIQSSKQPRRHVLLLTPLIIKK